MKALKALAYIAIAAGFILDYSKYGTITGRSFIVPLVIILYLLLECVVDSVTCKEDECDNK